MNSVNPTQSPIHWEQDSVYQETADGTCVDHSTVFYSGVYESLELLISFTSS